MSYRTVYLMVGVLSFAGGVLVMDIAHDLRRTTVVPPDPVLVCEHARLTGRTFLCGVEI